MWMGKAGATATTVEQTTLRAPLRCARACGARKGPFLSLPTLFGFAFARLQGGLNNVAPAALGQRRNEAGLRTQAGCLRSTKSFLKTPRSWLKPIDRTLEVFFD